MPYNIGCALSIHDDIAWHDTAQHSEEISIEKLFIEHKQKNL